jgi:hypothetical protein
MVVCIFFNIEFVKVIIGLVVLEVGGNKLSAVDRDKVSSTVYCINVNYRDVGGIVGLVGRLDHPHPSVFPTRTFSAKSLSWAGINKGHHRW